MYYTQISAKPFNPKRPGALVNLLMNVSENLGALYGSIAETRGDGFYAPCAECSGNIAPCDIDHSRMIAPELSLKNGAVLLWAGTDCAPVPRIRQLAAMLGVEYQRPLEEQDQQFISILLYGYDKEPVSFVHNKRPRTDYYRGCIPDLQSMIDAGTTSKGNRRMIAFFSKQSECPACRGTGLNKSMSEIPISGLTLPETAKLPIPVMHSFIKNLLRSMDPREYERVGPIACHLEPMLLHLTKIGLRKLPSTASKRVLT